MFSLFSKSKSSEINRSPSVDAKLDLGQPTMSGSEICLGSLYSKSYIGKLFLAEPDGVEEPEIPGTDRGKAELHPKGQLKDPCRCFRKDKLSVSNVTVKADYC